MLPEVLAERPRERLLSWGADRISDGDLLAVLLGTGVRGRSAPMVALDLLRATGGLLPLSRAAPRELAQVVGIGEARAARIHAAFHLGRRALEQHTAREPVLRHAEDAYQRLRPRLTGLAQEVCIVLALDARNAVISELEIARGRVNGVEVHPREVFRPLIQAAASGAVIAHNHPSGNAEPSNADLELTHRLRAAGHMMGIPILDHIIISDYGYRSLADYLGSDF